MATKQTFPGINVPGSNKWTEEEWQQLAEAIGATLVPLEPAKEEENKDGD